MMIYQRKRLTFAQWRYLAKLSGHMRTSSNTIQRLADQNIVALHPYEISRVFSAGTYQQFSGYKTFMVEIKKR